MFKCLSKVGIDPHSFSYGFQNEIMDHPCSDGGPESNRIGCTKFNEGCTKFCKGCTKGANVRSEVGNDLQSLSKVVQRNKWTIGRMLGVLLAQGLDVSNFLKNVPRVLEFISE